MNYNDRKNRAYQEYQNKKFGSGYGESRFELNEDFKKDTFKRQNDHEDSYRQAYQHGYNSGYGHGNSGSKYDNDHRRNYNEGTKQSVESNRYVGDTFPYDNYHGFDQDDYMSDDQYDSDAGNRYESEDSRNQMRGAAKNNYSERYAGNSRYDNQNDNNWQRETGRDMDGYNARSENRYQNPNSRQSDQDFQSRYQANEPTNQSARKNQQTKSEKNTKRRGGYGSRGYENDF